MNSEQTASVLVLLAEIRPEVDYRASEDYLGEGLLDSFDVVTLVHDLEQTFGVSIDGADIIPEYFANLDAIGALLHKNGVDA